MVAFRSVRQKSPELAPREIAALREMSKHRPVQDVMLDRLKELGLVELESDRLTDQGRIVLMFAAAR